MIPIRSNAILDGDVPVSTELLRVTFGGFPVLHEPRCYLFEDIGESVRLTPQQGTGERIEYRTKHTATPRECLIQWFREPDTVEFLPLGMKRGEYHPFIWRNGICAEQTEGVDAESIAVRAVDLPLVRPRMLSFHRIQKQLMEVFEVVTPGRENAAAHGAGIQQVLALAAFEIEALLSQAFRANSASTRSDMSNWIALAKPMRLAEWQAILPYFPEWQWVRPFAHRSSAVPPWWTAYNKLKHEPERRWKADLEAAISATCAVRILLEAQFGPGIQSLLIPGGPAEVEITERPRWAPEEVYFAPLSGKPLTPIPALG
jgi:hypothetical protein